MMFFFLALVAFTVAALLWWAMREPGARLLAFALIALTLAPLTAAAASIGSIANPIIDQVQGEVVRWIVGGALAAFWSAATWLGGVIGWRFIEKMNRATIQEAAERYANTIIDQIQVRYLASANGLPDLSDLVLGGIGYIKAGNGGTVKSGGFTDSKIGDYVTGAINDKLMRVLAKAGAPVAG